MKKLLLYNLSGNEVNLNFGSVTQLLGENGEEKEYIIKSLSKYFSNHKYAEYEEVQNYNIMINDDEIGRGYFKVDVFSNIDEIDKQMTTEKKAILSDYIINLVETFEINREVCSLNEHIEKIVTKFNENVQISSLNVEVDSIDYGIKELIKNHLQVKVYNEKYCNLEYISNINKIMCYLEILEKVNINSPQKRLIIFNNIDNYISVSEYVVLIKELGKISVQNDFYFILSTSKEGYACLDEELIKSINVVNDVIFNVPDIDIIREFVENNYPYYRQITNEEMLEMLSQIVHKIGKENKLINIDSQVTLKLINNQELKKTKGIKIPNKIELYYIQQE